MSAAKSKTKKSIADNFKKDKSVEITLCLGVFVLVLLKCCRTGVGQRKLVLTLLSTITPDNYFSVGISASLLKVIIIIDNKSGLLEKSSCVINSFVSTKSRNFFCILGVLAK